MPDRSSRLYWSTGANGSYRLKRANRVYRSYGSTWASHKYGCDG